MLYHRWEYSVTADETSIIQPDGCRDVILVSRPNEPDEIRITNWDSQPQAVRLLKGTKMVGYRLSPGTTIATTVLMNNDPNTFVLEGMIESEGTQSLEIFELIETLAQSNLTVQQVARQSGRTVRTLQRQFRDLSLHSPDYWRLLGRARRAAKALPCRVPLVEIAHEYGYSDQAHMTREFVRWFGKTPFYRFELDAADLVIVRPRQSKAQITPAITLPDWAEEKARAVAREKGRDYYALRADWLAFAQAETAKGNPPKSAGAAFVAYCGKQNSLR